MNGLPRRCPLVLVIAGHDPCGGAGIQADIEAVVSAQARAATLVTALTRQTSARFLHCQPVDAEALRAQGEALLEDIEVAAVKIGLLPTPALVTASARVLERLPGVPVVLDPVLAAGTGTRIVEHAVTGALREMLLPRVTLLTPNVDEVRELGNASRVEQAVGHLLEAGARSVLVTGTHARSERVRNTLHRPGESPLVFECARLPHTYHGSGCTLASAVAARLARRQPLEQAVRQALDYTWKTLAFGHRPGQGRHQPDRLFWSVSVP